MDLEVDKEVVIAMAFRHNVGKGRCVGVEAHQRSHEIKGYFPRESEIPTQ